MKKMENITIKRLNGKDVLKEDGTPVKLVDISITALEQGKGLGFKVFRTGQKLIAMQDVDAPEIILEDAELDGLKKAIKAGPFLDFVMEQVEEAIESAKDFKIG